MNRKEQIENAADAYIGNTTKLDEDFVLTKIKREAFIDGAKETEKILIKDVCNWLKSNLFTDIDGDDIFFARSTGYKTADAFIEDFKQTFRH